MQVTFLLNGETAAADGPPTRTLLDWLREERGLKGTKEGCNEGDCGACTVIVTDDRGARAVNACILLLPQVQGTAIRTVEGIAGPDGTLHPVQRAMIDHHGSQCGFCTPGFVVAMAAAHLNGDRDHDAALAGNLCRCTGYAPILRAAEAAAGEPVPDWMRDAAPGGAGAPESGEPGSGAADPVPPGAGWAAGIGDPTTPSAEPATAPDPAPEGQRGESTGGAASAASPLPVPPVAEPAPAPPGGGAALPASEDEAAYWYAAHPDGTLIAGATDVGLWVTKGLRDLGAVAFLHCARDMARIERQGDRLRIGAGASIEEVRRAVAGTHPPGPR